MKPKIPSATCNASTWVIGKDRKLTQWLSKSFLCEPNDLFYVEFLPFPTPELRLPSNEDRIPFHDDRVSKPLYLIVNALLRARNVKKVLSFDRRFASSFLERYPINSNKRTFPSTLLKSWTTNDGAELYTVYSVKMENGNTITLLDAPHYKFIRISDLEKGLTRKGLPYALQVIRKL